MMDKYVWRCRGNAPKHDIKINIRRKSILDGLHINLQILYFIIFHCFVENKSLNETLCETEDFSK